MAFIIDIKRPVNIRDRVFRDSANMAINAADFIRPNAPLFNNARTPEHIAVEINRAYPGAGATVREIRTQREKELIGLINQIIILDAAIATSEWEIADIAIMYFFDNPRIPTDIEGAVKAYGAAKVQDTILSRAYAQEKGRLMDELTKLTCQLTIGAEMYTNERTGKSYMLFK